MKKRLSTASIIVFVVLCILLVRPSAAVVLLSDEEALEQMFPEADNMLTENNMLTPKQVDNIKERLGGKWVLYQSGSKSGDVNEESICTMYFAEKAGKKIGVAVMETQPGKWGPVQYIIALDMSGKVKDLAVMMYVEKRGKPIARRRFLGQFIGKTSADPIMTGKDIDAISGATISSRATAFAVKKVITIYEVLYLDKTKGVTKR